MATSYSDNLKIALQGTGDNPGTWGTVTNGNLGTVIEQAIVGRGTVTFPSDSNYTLPTMANGPATSPNRCLYLNVTSTGNLSTVRTLTLENIQKTYIIKNATSAATSPAYAITVAKSGGGTTVTVPNGSTMLLYVDTTAGVSQQFSEIASGTTIGGVAVVDLSSTQTLTGKTLTSPTITSPTVTLGSFTTPAISKILSASFRSTTTTNIQTTNASPTVVITDNANGAVVGDYITLSGITVDIGGIPFASLNTTFAITAVTTNTVTITAGSNGNGGGGGSGTTIVYRHASTVPAATTTLDGVDNVSTLTNKRITPRITTNGTTYTGTITPVSDTTDQFVITGLTGAVTIANPTATVAATQGQKFTIRITDGGARANVNVTNGMSCVNGSREVTVTNNTYSAVAGDYVTISGATTFGGISAANLNTRFLITVAAAGSIRFNVATAATSTVTGSGGTATLSYDGFKITWGAEFRAVGTDLPAATTAGKVIYVGCIRNTTGPYWDVVAVSAQV